MPRIWPVAEGQPSAAAVASGSAAGVVQGGPLAPAGRCPFWGGCGAGWAQLGVALGMHTGCIQAIASVVIMLAPPEKK